MDWQTLESRDDELYDPLFQGDLGFTCEFQESFPFDYYVPGSATEQPYLPSAAGSVIDGPSSSWEYTVSGPTSALDGPSSLGRAISHFGTSPSFSTTATSPLFVNEEQPCEESFNVFEPVFSPIRTTAESPILDTRQERLPQNCGTSSSQGTSPSFLNPYVSGSAYSFSGLDVSASQAFANVGGWADHPLIIEPGSELDRSEAIPIPQSTSQSFSNTFSSYPWSNASSLDQSRARAITIPQPSARAASYNPSLAAPKWVQEVPPVLSVSPEARRRSRGTTLSRANSKNEARRGRNSLTTPSPTSNTFGWVSYKPNNHTNRLVPSGSDGNRGRSQRGRTKALTMEQRRNAALMRVVGACSNCKKRKEKCDPGTPCKSCLDHYKNDLVHFPCRDRLLSDLSKALLSDRLGWHPTARALDSFTAPNSFKTVTGLTYTIPLSFGFGPALHVPVNAMFIENTTTLYHHHVIYAWPPTSSTGDKHTHAVLPAVLTQDAFSNLTETLDAHLSLLVTQHFRSFPLYCSPLRILRDVYVFSRSLPTNTPHSHLLHQALKLLVLVHIGGDLTLPPPSTDPILAQLIRTSTSLSPDITPTPCFIRSQFGAVMPSLALSLMQQVLSSLEQLFLTRDNADWPLALAALTVVLMTIESIHYHAAKLPYHHHYGSTRRANQDEQLKVDDQGVSSLLAFYSACFLGCHARLRPDWEGEADSAGAHALDMKPEDRFVESVRDALRKASQGGYLAQKAKDEREGEDMGFFFDRLVARLLILKN
ncbi:hypothetical protein BDV95DRAFT_483675 [Massariosphaeria phaeospora]|uniref:Zn(2)-C6 fungal-type domain-containing protein n=1 Tax=Massariosphaeria phaeospora TaxID=100035 RepID=A0A7C8MFG0_9PLEO|nr:hypothetical protein BDV95DRAFT_483675 [Massariosphaeria phaeospora]